jgi:hypothetical protein
MWGAQDQVRPRKLRHCVTWRGTTARTHLAVRARAKARERRCWRLLITLLLLVLYQQKKQRGEDAEGGG